MTTVFVSGSRRIAQLPTGFRRRLDRLIADESVFLVGDANGGDKAIQKHLAGQSYRGVTVYCTEGECRNNVGAWPQASVATTAKRGFAFFAAKDRKMASLADLALCVWDGSSPGTIINALRVSSRNRPVEIFSQNGEIVAELGRAEDWIRLYERGDDELKARIGERLTADEWPNAKKATAQFELAI